MNKADSCIILPSHWLVNAGIIGLLELLRDQGGLKEKVEKLLREDGGIDGEGLRLLVEEYLQKEVSTPCGFGAPELLWWYLTYPRHMESLLLTAKMKENLMSAYKEGDLCDFASSIFTLLFWTKGISPYYNLVNPGAKPTKPAPPAISVSGKRVWHFMDFFSREKIFFRNEDENKSVCDLTGWTKYKVKTLDYPWLTYLLPSYGRFPNSLRDSHEEGCLRAAMPIAYLIPLHHISFARLEEGRLPEGGTYHVYGFINAPSFLVMYHLNRLLRQYGLSGGAKEAFAWSLISYYLRTKRMLTKWVYQNAELILRRETFTKGGKEVSIDTLSIPTEVAALLEDAEVRKRIHRIGSVEVLKAVLSKRHDILEKRAYEELRSSIKEVTEERKSGSDGKGTSSSSGRKSSAEKAKDLIFLLGAIREFERKRLLSVEWEI